MLHCTRKKKIVMHNLRMNLPDSVDKVTSESIEWMNNKINNYPFKLLENERQCT